MDRIERERPAIHATAAIPAASNISDAAISSGGIGVDAIRIGMVIGDVNGMRPSTIESPPSGALRMDSRKSIGAIIGTSARNCTDCASCSLVTAAPTVAKTEP